MFEYGLWEKSDLDNLLRQIYSISEIMFNLENLIFKEKNYKVLTQEYITECIETCTSIRELIASILLHFLIYFLDEDLYNRKNYFPFHFSGKNYKHY